MPIGCINIKIQIFLSYLRKTGAFNQWHDMMNYKFF